MIHGEIWRRLFKWSKRMPSHLQVACEIPSPNMANETNAKMKYTRDHTITFFFFDKDIEIILVSVPHLFFSLPEEVNCCEQTFQNPHMQKNGDDNVVHEIRRIDSGVMIKHWRSCVQGFPPWWVPGQSSPLCSCTCKWQRGSVSFHHVVTVCSGNYKLGRLERVKKEKEHV